jgi:4-hydroxy-tetrahydrodipicolinate synthase
MELPTVVVPVLTPFDGRGNISLPGLRRQINYVIEDCRAPAVAAAAVETQEYQYLSFDKRVELIRRTAEFTGGRCSLVVGVSHPAIERAVELAHIAEEAGAQAVQALIPLRPFGGQPKLGEVTAYFEMIARSTSLPIIAYHNPGPGATLPADWMVELARIPEVKYFKESSRDLTRIMRLIVEIEDAGLAHFLTTMEVLLITLQLGGSGATVPPPAARLAVEVVEAYQQGDLEEAVKRQKRFALFPSKWMEWGLAPVMKSAMRAVGVEVGGPHPPFQALPDKEYEQLSRHLEEIGLRHGGRAEDGAN